MGIATEGANDDRVTHLAQAILSSLMDAVAVVDARGRVLEINQSFRNLTGLRHREIARRIGAGVTLLDLLRPVRDDARRAIEESLAGGRSTGLAEVALETEQGEALTAWLSFVPLDQPAGGGLLIIRDVSAEARMQGRFKELLALTHARAEDLERMVSQRTRELRVALDEVTRLSRTDPLTGVLNRRAFTEAAERSLSLVRRHRRQAALVMCDLDHFKALNDTCGHAAGDAVLVGTARALEHTVRESDLVARFGGEEFLVLLTEVESGGVVACAERCREAIGAMPLQEWAPKAPGRQTASFGVAVFPRDGTELEDLILKADSALYRAKEAGRDCVVVYDQSTPRPRIEVGVPSQTVLVIDEDAARRDFHRRVLGTKYRVHASSSAEDAAAFSRRERCDVILAGGHTEEAGIDSLRRVLPLAPHAVRILLTRSDAFLLAHRSSVFAAVDRALTGNLTEERLLAAVEDALQRRDVLREQLSASTPLMGEMLQRSHIEQALEGAFSVHYQPIVSARTLEVMAYEALCRFQNVGGSPADVFELAVREQLIWDLGRCVRHRAVSALERMPPQALLFLNLHAAELAEPSLFFGEQDVEQHARRIVFEITERTSMGDVASIEGSVARLRRRGYRVAIDDLGAGYSSLNCLAWVAPDFVKVDMALARGIESSTTRQRLVEGILNIAHAEGMQVIAEGIETEQEARVLEGMGCDLLQGYLFGRPAPL